MKLSCYLPYLFTLTLFLGFTHISVAETATEIALKKAAVARFTNLQQAKRFAEEARLLAQKKKNTLGEALAHKELGIIAFLKENLEEALSHYEESIVLFTEEGQEQEVGEIKLRCAAIYGAMEKPEEAFLHYFELLEVAQDSGNLRLQALAELAGLYNAGGLYEEAIQTYRTYLAEVDYQDLARQRQLQQVHSNLFKALEKSGQVEEAEALYERVLYQDFMGKFRYSAFHQLARLNFEQEDYEDAAHYCEQIKDAFGSKGAPSPFIAHLYTKVLLAQGNYEEALTEALAIKSTYLTSKIAENTLQENGLKTTLKYVIQAERAALEKDTEKEKAARQKVKTAEEEKLTLEIEKNIAWKAKQKRYEDASLAASAKLPQDFEYEQVFPSKTVFLGTLIVLLGLLSLFIARRVFASK